MEELAFFKNQLNNISDANEQDKYRKSLVLILYAHMEGYIKIALQTYIKFLNSQNLCRREVVSGLIAASMNIEFTAYDNLDKKSQVFRNKLPTDEKLHRFARRIEFVECFEDFMEKPLVIADSVINTESNLRFVVLQKNLYQLGIPFDQFQQFSKDIDALVNRRNAIAHGSERSGVSCQEFSNWENKVKLILAEITMELYKAANRQIYLKNPNC